MQVPSEGGLRDPGVVRRVRLLDQRAPPQGVQTHLLQLGRVVPRLRVWTVALLREAIQKTSFAIEQIFWIPTFSAYRVTIMDSRNLLLT